MYDIQFPKEVIEQYKYAIERAREDRPRYFNFIKKEIEILIGLINKFDKKYIIGTLGSKLIKSIPTMFNQLLTDIDISENDIQEEDLITEDEDIEVLLEYAMSIALATTNSSKKIPKKEDVEIIYEQLKKIKININFWELSAENPNGNEFDHWLRTNVMQETINVRGNGYHIHIQEIFIEIFEPFNDFIERYYGFNATDIFETIKKLDDLVYSKIGNPVGGVQSHKRFSDWMDKKGEKAVIQKMLETGKHFIQQFTEENPDLYNEEIPESIALHSLDSIESYNTIFWVIPQTKKEEIIFDKLSLTFGDNGNFFQPPKFKGFPLNDTLINLKPLIKEYGKYYHFSLNLSFRNIFRIVERLIKDADEIYYYNSFKGNKNYHSRDNYIERKTKELFEKMLPKTTFYHSLEYTFTDNNDVSKKTELDILGISENTIYIIEVKAGELNTKHRRGAMKGLKDRLKETINEGSYQCHRAQKHINENDTPTFEYIEDGIRKTISLNKINPKKINKISVTFEHFGSISANLKYLINSNILSSDFKWTWIVSLYDLMIFSDLIENENDFEEYLENRINLYDRNDIVFSDEIDILGFYLNGEFPLEKEKKNRITHIANSKTEIDEYYTMNGVGIFKKKPKKK